MLTDEKRPGTGNFPWCRDENLNLLNEKDVHVSKVRQNGVDPCKPKTKKGKEVACQRREAANFSARKRSEDEGGNPMWGVGSQLEKGR